MWGRPPILLTELGRMVSPTSADYPSQLFDLLETTLAIGGAYGLMRTQRRASPNEWQAIVQDTAALLDSPTVGTRAQLIRRLDKHERGVSGWLLKQRCRDELTYLVEVVSPDQLPKRRRPALSTALSALCAARNGVAHPGSLTPEQRKLLIDGRLFEAAIKVLIEENELFSPSVLRVDEYGTLSDGQPGVRATRFSGESPFRYKDHAVIENPSGAKPGQLFLTLEPPLLLHPLFQERRDEVFLFWELEKGRPLLRHPGSNTKVEDALVGEFLSLDPASFGMAREKASALGWEEAVASTGPTGRKKPRRAKAARQQKRKRAARNKEQKAVQPVVRVAADPAPATTAPAKHGPTLQSHQAPRVLIWVRTTVALIVLSLAGLGGLAFWLGNRADFHAPMGGSAGQSRGPTDASAHPSSSPPPQRDGAGCGELSADPSTIDRLDDWHDWRCKSEENVSRRIWASCLRHGHYDSVHTQGCPGEERCCPPDAESAWRQEEQIRRLIRSHCGHPRAHHRDSFTDWDSYRCRAEGEVDGATWRRCLRRSEYSDQVGRGCIEGMLCCHVDD